MEFQRDERVERRRARRRQIRRRRLAAAVVVLGVAGLIAASTTNLLGPDRKSEAPAAEPPPITYSRGGTTLLPNYRLVALFGAPRGGKELGRLGVGTPTEATNYLMNEIVPLYESNDRPVMPALELIATIVHRTPTDTGRYSTRYSDEQVAAYHQAARNVGAILILDVQPGQSPWMDEVRAYRHWLEEPDVSFALDPEWKVDPGEIPGETRIGTITAAEINEVSAYMQEIVDANKLPQKVLIVHQFKDYQLKDQSAIVDRPGVKVVLNIDGYGPADQKIAAYEALTDPARGKEFPWGFKLFFEEDTRNGGTVMTPLDVLGLNPEPDVVVYE